MLLIRSGSVRVDKSMESGKVKPYPAEIAEARKTPGGWVYRIAGEFDNNVPTPPDAIVGAWEVNKDGLIIGEFIRNQNYDPSKWPAK